DHGRDGRFLVVAGHEDRDPMAVGNISRVGGIQCLRGLQHLPSLISSGNKRTCRPRSAFLCSRILTSRRRSVGKSRGPASGSPPAARKPAGFQVVNKKPARLPCPELALAAVIPLES